MRDGEMLDKELEADKLNGITRASEPTGGVPTDTAEENGAGDPPETCEVTETKPEDETAAVTERGDGTTADAYIPKNRTERVMLAVYKSTELTASLKISSMAIVVLTVYALLYDLVLALSCADYYHIVAVLVTTGVPFVAVSVMRRLLNSKRPYELLPFFSTPPKAKLGQSFPSRHVFSVFVIGSVLLASNLTVGLLLLLAGILLAAVRVLLGIHFVKDVAAGAVIGVISGIGGALIFGLFG
ncbi:MAG: phosphatase PAP2 family protein [Clostridia bacterium]|nr:phosphatase PAP2 family protein [Clostridia bacterium]